MAQCPGCQIDATCGVGINPVEPTLCPPALPNGVQGQPYDQDLTFYMPRDFTDQESGAAVTLNSITVTQITGMPQGLSFQCNNAGCNYTVTNDPLTQRGCVKICGIPNVPGNYSVLVSVIANVNTPLGVINQPSGFSIALTIEPSPGGNCCFSYNPPSNCGPMNVTYGALFDFAPLQPTTWEWDFGNGNTSSVQNPPVQSYTAPGDYYPELITTVYDYVITDVSFTATGSNWCGDVEEISFLGVCQGAPDIYFNFTNGSQTATSSSVANNLNAGWSNQSFILENNVFTLQFFDEDGTSQDDNLGIVSQNVTAPGTFNFSTFVNGTQEGFGSVTVALAENTVYETIDTVSVYAVPPVPQVDFNPGPAVCAGDSILLQGPAGPYQYQWFKSSSFESDSIALWVSITGYYSLLVVDTTHFCQNQTDSFLVQVLPFPNQPVLSYNNQTDELEVTNNTSGYDVTWYEDGEVIVGANGNSIGNLSSSGPFTVVFTNAGGCTGTSLPFSLCLPGATDPFAVDTVCCGQTVDLSASGFTLNPFSTIAWAITPETFGPVTNAEEAAAANDAGYVLGISNLGANAEYTRICNSLADSALTGNYWVTPFAIENPNVTPLTYDTLVGCRPRAEICPELSAADDNWALFPMIFTFPDGSQLNANDAIAFGLPITQQLIDFAGGLPCINLTSLYAGDPNGHWSVTITNTGTTDLEMVVPDFLVINYADTCELIDQDETYLITGVTLMAAANGGTVSYDFYLPPLPGGFPLVSDNCAAFGTPKPLTFVNCYPDTSANVLVVSGTAQNSTSGIAPNGYIDVSVTGGTPPYSFAWADGPTSEDRFNLAPGTYSVVVTDAVGAIGSGSWTVGGPGVGIEEQLAMNGFALGNAVPNPFSQSTTISFQSRQAGSYVFDVRDLTGRRVASMEVKAGVGENRILFDGSSLSDGVYIYSLTNGTSVLSNRLVVGH
ncbi:MAG: T9SS type A sorting domain-containing protein [Flavobacteriales bacterium]|nr:T9SS type A sorting domain-containing protein [Flavobacteriales bacterium]